jgi:alkyldihydroxyacetonephosphate synthase
MQRWNGWGDKNVEMDLPEQAQKLLLNAIGEGMIRDDYTVDELIQNVPRSRLSKHPLVSTDPKQRLIHAHGQSLSDWIGLRWGSLKRFPDGIAIPNTIDEVQDLLDFALKHKIIIIPYGGGTSVLGQLTVPESKKPVLTISLKHLNRLIDLDPYNRLATFEAGVKGPDLEAQLRARNFTMGHYPQSFEYSSLGGWIVTRACGQESTYYGRMDELFAGGELLTPKGPMKFPPFPASAAGPDLRHLLLGSEGRLGIITKAIVKISPLPERHDIYGLFFPSWESAVEAVRILAGTRLPFSMIRLSNPAETVTNLALAGHEKQIALLKHYLRLRDIPDREACMCLIGFIGSPRMVSAARREVTSIVNQHDCVFVGKTMGEAWKNNRFRAPYLRNTLWDMGYAVETVETSVTWSKVTTIMQEVEKAARDSLASIGEKVLSFTHLSSVYPTGSSVYTTFLFRLAETAEETLARWITLKEAASRAIIAAGGTISHQHGVGLDHKSYLESEKGSLGVSTLRDIFSHIDPNDRMNPTKLV